MFVALLVGNASMIMPMSLPLFGYAEDSSDSEDALPIQAPMIIMPMEQPAAPAQEQRRCAVCLEDEPGNGFPPLVCGHDGVCAGCLTDQIDPGLAQWQELDQRLHCSEEGCQYVMNAVDIQNVTGDAVRVAAYNRILTDRFINANQNFRRCPTAQCEVIYEFDRAARTIRCELGCHQEYCSDCRIAHPQGAACNQPIAPAPNDNNAPANEEQVRRAEQERQQQEWIRQNTRPCPRCRANIQKDGGCNHMTCRACNHEFCWFHLRAWNADCQRDHWFNAHPELDDEAARAAQALRVVPEPVAPAPIDWAQRFQADIAGDDELRFLGILDPVNHGNNNNQHAGFNNPNPAQPAGPGRQFRAQPAVKGTNPFLIAAGVSVVAAAVTGTVYGCYRLYKYVTAPKPHLLKDVKVALAELHKEAIRSKGLAQSSAYTLGSLKAFYDAQTKAGSYASLSQEKSAMLTTRVNALEAALSVQGAIEEEYVSFVRCVSALLQAVNNAVVATPIVTPVGPVIPVVIPLKPAEITVKTVKPALTKKPVTKRLVRAKRVRKAKK